MHNSSSLVIIKKYILLATGTPSSIAMRDSVFVLYGQANGQNQLAELIDTFMADLAINHDNGVNGVIQDIAYNGFGLDMSDHAVDQLKDDLGSQGINTWSKLFAFAAIELEGELGAILHNRSEAANLFTDLLAELNAISDYNGPQVAYAAHEWLMSIGSTDESLVLGTGAIRSLIESFNGYHHHDHDEMPPELIYSMPMDGATDFQADNDIVFEFNEPVMVDEGVIIISNGTDTRVIDVEEDADLISFDGNQLIIDPGADLEADTTYSLTFEGEHEHRDEHDHREEHKHKDKGKDKGHHGRRDEHERREEHGHRDEHEHREEHEHRDKHEHKDDGVITDLAGNVYMGPVEFHFTTIAAADPYLIDSIPFDEDVSVPVDNDITLIFSEMVTVGIGDIIIRNSLDATDTRVIAVDDASQVIFDGSNVIIDPILDLQPNATYNIELADGVIVDLLGHAYIGISDPTELNFTTIISEPQLVNSAPLDDAVDVQIADNIVLTFSEEVVVGSGNFVISNVIGDVQTIAVDDASQVTVDGLSVLINPLADLLPGDNYFIQWNEGIVVDLVGNPTAGISDEVTLNFSTALA